MTVSLKKTLPFALLCLAIACTNQSNRGDKDSPSHLEGDEREKEIERLTNKKDFVILTEIDDRYEGGIFDLENYDSPPCEEIEGCTEICLRLVSSSRRNRCKKKPYKLIEAIEQGVINLLDIADLDSVNVSPGLFQAMLEIDDNIIPSLIKQESMSVGDLRSFLAWVALSKDITQVLSREDRSHDTLKDAFDRLGELQKSSQRDLITGFNTGLIGKEDTFLFLATKNDNEEAFIIGHKIIERDICSTKDCKLKVYCARERARGKRRHERINVNYSCRSPGKKRRYRQSDICYVHGEAVWSYLYNLIEEEEIKSPDLQDAMIETEKCNSICGDEDSDICDAIK